MVNLGLQEELISILEGHPPLVALDREGKEHLNVLRFLQVQSVLLNQELRTQVQETIGSKTFARLAQKRYHEVVPFLLVTLRQECMHDIDGYIQFIVDGAVVAGLTHEMYLSTKELGALRRAAHLRTATWYASRLQTNFGEVARLAIAIAVLAGITPAEIGVGETEVSEWIDKLLYRKAADARLTRIWNAHEARTVRFNALEDG